MCSSVDAEGGGGEAAEVVGAMESIAAADAAATAAAPDDVCRDRYEACLGRVRNGWLAVVWRTKWARRFCEPVAEAVARPMCAFSTE